jgi:prolyl-tRNA synthetase
MMQDGKALQMGTSHYLGQGFAKSANIQFQDKNGQMQHVHTTSWGVSTRMIGGLIMTHADDDGLRLPPRIAPKQIVIVPILRDNADQNAQVLAYAESLVADLKKQTYADEKLRVQLDLRDKPAPDKKWEWIKKGAPLIVEIGPRDVADNKVALKLRTAINDKAQFLPRDQFVADAATHLQAIHDTLWAEARGFRDANIRTDITDFETFKAHFGDFDTDDEGFISNKGNKFIGFVRAPWCGCGDTTEPMMKKLAVSIRCLPFDQKPVAELGPCVLTGKPATCEVIYARSY